MLFGANKKIASAPGKGRMSVRKIQHFATQKRHSLVRVLYGALLIIISITLLVLDPIALIMNYSLEMKEGRIAYEAFRDPQYKIYMDTYVFNYTNLDAFVEGRDTKLKLDEIGPFSFRELRTDENMEVDTERGVLTMNPHTRLQFIREKSVAHYRDVQLVVPNLVLISFSTYLADNMGYLANVGAYYSMRTMGSKLVLNMTAEQLMWGYEDPLVSLASKILPHWIDFKKTGIIDRFYADKKNVVELELGNKSRKYSINKWDNSLGLKQQGYTDWETSHPCNRLKNTYEGMMITPNLPKNTTIGIFRSYGCRVFPFDFTEEVNYRGLKAYRYDIQNDTFLRGTPYACPCTKNCLPDGFVDISGCYYGFPIALSKPHLLDVDPQQQAYFEGLKPDPTLPVASAYFEPTVGAPLKAVMRLQINAAVRASVGNPITKPLKDIVLPYIRLEMYCEEPPSDIYMHLYMALVIGPPAMMVLISLLTVVGMYLGARGFYDYFRSEGHVVLTSQKKKERKSITSLTSVDIHSTDGREVEHLLTADKLNVINETHEEGM